jgi:glutathione S-transferase
MIIYGTPKTRALRAVWTAEEAGVDYDYRHVDLMKGEARTREFLKLNLAGKVPVLIDEDLILTESAAICNYIARSRPNTALVPEDLTRLARFEQWCSFVQTELEQPLWTMAKHRYALSKEHRVPAVIETAEWEYQRALKVMQRGVNRNKYLVGDQFTVADILAGHTIRWGEHYGLPCPPAIQSYRDRVLGRDALKRAERRMDRSRSET